MGLLDVLACPVCKADVAPSGSYLQCSACGRLYPLMDGVPIMLPDWETSNVKHEGELSLREGYDPWVHRMVMQSLADDQVVVDIGCGNMLLDDPCIIRMDVLLTPYTDVVGDVHALPFKPASIDYILSLAVFEHLRQPFLASEEIYSALKPGGYAYTECNFVFPYHGYPHHYFNASIHGLRQLFAKFAELRVGVAPYQMPSFAVESLLNSYLNLFNATDPEETEFVHQMHRILEYPLRAYDGKFSQETAFRIAAGGYFLGIKQPNGSDTIIPTPVIDIYSRSPELQSEYPNLYDLSAPANVMVWAKTRGHKSYPELARFFAEMTSFSKYMDGRHPNDRSKIHGLPVIPEPGGQQIIEAATANLPEKGDDSSIFRKAISALKCGGLKGLTKKSLDYLRWKLG